MKLKGWLKLKEWLRRYGPAELYSFIAVLAASKLFLFLTGSIVITAFLSAWVMNFVFYGTIIYSDLMSHKKKKRKITFKDYLKQARNMLMEFGPSEYLDSFVIRPFFLIFFPYFIKDYLLAVSAATITADIIYFVPVIVSYELRKKVFRE